MMKRKSILWPGIPIALLVGIVIGDVLVITIACQPPDLVTEETEIIAPDAASRTGGAPSTAASTIKQRLEDS